MQKLAIILIGLLFICATFLFHSRKSEQTDEFYSIYQKFQETYHKYDNPVYRYSIFAENYKKILLHNSDLTQTYIQGVNQFTDITQQEFVQTYLMIDLPAPELVKTFDQVEQMIKNGDVPNDIDWRDKGAVTAVKNQGSCGSCWSFSTTGAIEGAHKIQKQVLPSLSEQQLVDCCVAPKYKCQGCRGAWPDWSMQYVKDNGITTEEEYPYKAVQQQCKKQGGAYKINSYQKISPGESTLTSAINSVPVSICCDASNWSSYKTGIFSNCGTSTLNHAILLIGYTADSWIVKNSWGPNWGEKGYIRLKRPGNTCGIYNYAITASF